MLPAWIYSASDTDDFVLTVSLSAYDKKSIYITDARRVGIMLRGGRLTLRNHSALTRFIVEAVSDTDIVLQAPAVGEKSYVHLGDKGAFFANASRDQAQKFQLKPTDIGVELYLADQRPAVFDDFYDVSVGKWQTGLSSIALLVHKEKDMCDIWKSYETGNSSSAPAVPGVGGIP